MEANTFHSYFLRLGKILLCVFYFHPDLFLYESKREKKAASCDLKAYKHWPQAFQEQTVNIEATKIMQEFISQ